MHEANSGAAWKTGLPSARWMFRVWRPEEMSALALLLGGSCDMGVGGCSWGLLYASPSSVYPLIRVNGY